MGLATSAVAITSSIDFANSSLKSAPVCRSLMAHSYSAMLGAMAWGGAPRRRCRGLLAAGPGAKSQPGKVTSPRPASREWVAAPDTGGLNRAIGQLPGKTRMKPPMNTDEHR